MIVLLLRDVEIHDLTEFQLDPNSLTSLYVRSSNGSLVPMGAFAHVNMVPVSLAITHRRRISAPSRPQTSWGATVLPSDLDILRPCSSSTKPCVSTASNGARPRVPHDSSSDDFSDNSSDYDNS